MSSYTQAIDEVKRQIEKIPEVSLYLDGNRTVAGISDIDFVVVTDNVDPSLKQIFNDAQDKYAEIILHEPLYLSRKLAESFPSVMANNDHKWTHVCGPKINFSKPTTLSIDFRRWEDVILHMQPRLLRLRYEKKANVRLMLSKLAKVRFFLPDWILADASDDYKKKFKTYVDDFSKFRKEWFNKDVEENLSDIIKFLDRAIAVQEEGLVLFGVYVKKNYSLTSKTKITFFSHPYHPMVFSDRLLPLAGELLWREMQTTVLILPSSLASILWGYAQFNNVLGREIRRSLTKNSATLKKEVLPFIKKRSDYFCEQIIYCKKFNLDYGPLVSFQLHYRVKNPKKMFMRKLRFLRKASKIRTYFSLLTSTENFSSS